MQMLVEMRSFEELVRKTWEFILKAFGTIFGL